MACGAGPTCRQQLELLNCRHPPDRDLVLRKLLEPRGLAKRQPGPAGNEGAALLMFLRRMASI